jgi:drug/metabolite transporter (DMT)-like permease
MNPARIAGVVLLAIGVVMLIYGINASHSLADRLSKSWSGRFTERTTWYIIGGIASGLAGLLVMASGGRRNSN